MQFDSRACQLRTSLKVVVEAKEGAKMLSAFCFCRIGALVSQVVTLSFSVIASMDETQVMYLLSTIA